MLGLRLAGPRAFEPQLVFPGTDSHAPSHCRRVSESVPVSACCEASRPPSGLAMLSRKTGPSDWDQILPSLVPPGAYKAGPPAGWRMLTWRLGLPPSQLSVARILVPSASAPITILGETGVNVLTRWWRAAGGRDRPSLLRMAFWLPGVQRLDPPTLIAFQLSVFVGLQAEKIFCEA